MKKLNDKQLNNMIRSAFADAAPDKSAEIIGAAKNSRATIFCITQENRRGKNLGRAAAIAVAAAVVIAALFTLMTVKNRTPYGSIMIESDESIEIILNRYGRPVTAVGNNLAALKLESRIDSCDNVQKAIDGALDEMLENDNLSESNNTVLITVDMPEDEDQLLSDCFDAARGSFEESGFDGAILTALATDDKEVARISRRNHISVGKAEMVRDIIRADHTLRTDLLCRLSVNDLNFLSDFKAIRYVHIGVYGKSYGYITPQEAVARAAEDLGDSEAIGSATLSVDNTRLVYSVTVRSGEENYFYRLSASSGEILNVSHNDDPQTALMSDKDAFAEDRTDAVNDPKKESSEAAKNGAQTIIISRDNSSVDDRQSATEGRSETPSTARTAPKSADKTTPKPAPATSKTTEKPASPKPTTAPKSTEPQQTATSAPITHPPIQPPTQQPKPDPAIFTASSYLRYTGGVQSGSPLTSSARSVSVRRVVNGYNTFYDAKTFPYTAAGKQGSVSALVCSAEQFRRLTGRSDARFNDAFFATHALYIYMNRDVSYHWIKSIEGAYMDGGTLCLLNSDPVGYYITTDKDNPERIYTVIYELNKSELTDCVNMVEYTD